MLTKFLDWLSTREHELQVILCGAIGGLIMFFILLSAILLWNVAT